MEKPDEHQPEAVAGGKAREEERLRILLQGLS